MWMSVVGNLVGGGMIRFSLFSRFIIQDKDEFFTNAQRSAMVHDLLLRAHYSPTKFGKSA